MLIVSKYGHLCRNLTFIGYLCEICSMSENMVICVEIRLSLDICVKYAQCVKIWLFMKCVQFLKSCVQFLNPTIAQFHGEKGRCALGRCVSHRRQRKTRQRNERLTS
jgi:hypothetical protein